MPHEEIHHNYEHQQPLTNGEQPHSLFLSHLTSYRLVADALKTLHSLPAARYAGSVVAAARARLAASPLARRAYPVVVRAPADALGPLARRADALAAAGLTRLDAAAAASSSSSSASESSSSSAVAVVEALRARAVDVLAAPLQLAAGAGRHVVDTYRDEYAKSGAAPPHAGIMATGRAVVATELRIAAEVLGVVVAYLSAGARQTDKAAAAVHEKMQ